MTDLYGNIPISGDSKKKHASPPSKKIKETPPPSSPKTQKDHPQGKGKYLIIPAIIIVLILISYYGLTTLCIPLYLEKKFPELFQEKTGLSLDLGSVNFNPLKSALIIDEVKISTLSLNSDKTDLLDIDTVYVDLDLAAFIKHGIASESLLIKGALLTITKYDDSTYNISRFLPQGSTPSSAFVNLSNVPFLYSLNNIVVSDSKILFEDISTNTTHRIENIHLSLPKIGNFSYDVDNYIQPGFSAVINGSPVKLTSDEPYSATAASDESSKLSLSLQSINLPLYASYIPAKLPVTVTQGSADIKIEIAFKAQQSQDFHLNFDFQAQIENGLFESNDKAVTLAAPALRLEGSIMPLVRQIQMQNVLFRDPTLTIKDSISSSTITSLFPQDSKDEQTRDDFLHTAALDVSLLIADNGKCIVKSKDGERIYNPVQLSIKNFSNANSLIKNPGNSEKSSFRLSGESEDNTTTFNWQGSFKNTSPTGNLEISKLPADDFLKLLVPNTDLKTKGSAEIQGKLSIKRSKQSPLAVILDKGSVVISSLALERNGLAVLQSSNVKLSPFHLNENTVNLGNIFLEDATLQIDEKNPQILTDLLSKKSNTAQGIDFKGKIIVGKKKNKKSLKIQNVHLQINDLEKSKKEKDNFAFTATINQNGSLNAKGKVSLSPFDGSVEVAATKIPADMLFFTTNNSNYSLTPGTMLDAKGSYTLSSGTFDGTAELSMGELNNSHTKNSYTFGKAVFGKISINRKKARYSGENVFFKDFTLNSKSFNLQTDGLSIASFDLEGKTTRIDSLEFAKTEIASQNDFSNLFSSLQQEAESDLSIFAMHMFGSISTADKNQHKLPFIDEFDLTIKTPNADAPEKKDIDFKAHFVNHGTLSANGQIQIQPLQLQVSVALDQVSSTILQHFPSTLGQSQLTTTMSGTINFTYPERIFTGNIQFNNGYLADKASQPLFSWQKAELQNFKLGDSPFILEADRLFINNPQTSFISDNTSVLSTLQHNVFNYLNELDAQSNSSADAKITIQRVEFNDGLIDYNISGLSPPWNTDLTSVNGSINNFHVPEAGNKTDYSLQGRIADGNFSLAGSLSSSPDSPENETSFKLTTFPLTLFEKQLGSLFDIRFTESILDVSIKKQDSEDDYSADITLTSPQIKDYNSTTALTLALISQNRDKLSLSIPLKNTSQSLFTQLNNYFQRLIVKCSVSPYLLLDSPHSTLRDRDSVSFTPGKTELTFESRDTLLDYSTLLEQHPLLQLKLDTTVQRSADTKALREILTDSERKRVQQENDQLLLEWQQRQINTDGGATPNDDIAVKDISAENLAEFTPNSLKDIIITEKMLKQLGIERAEKIRNYILDQSTISEDNISVDVNVSIIDTLDLPEVSIHLGHVGQK